MSRVLNPTTNLHEAILSLDPGKYEYKFIIDNIWLCDPNKETNENGNNMITIEKNSYNIYENLTYPRTIFNKFQKKLAEKYPEGYLEKKVICFQFVVLKEIFNLGL